MKSIVSKCLIMFILIAILSFIIQDNIALRKDIIRLETTIIEQETIIIEKEIELNQEFDTMLETLDVEDMFKVASAIYDIDYLLPYAIAIHETGWFKSSLYLNKNNPGGIKDGDGWRAYNSKFEGIVEMCAMLKKHYINKGLTTPELIGTRYCPDTASDWAFKVNQLMNDLR